MTILEMKTIRFGILLLTVLTAVTGCKKDETPQNVPVDVDVSVSFAGEEYAKNLDVEGVTVNVYSASGQMVFQGTTDATGTIKVEQLSPATYTLQATKVYAASDFNAAMGKTEEADVTFTTEQKIVEVSIASEKSFDLQLMTGTTNALVIKQIYYTGSHAQQGASFRDQFIEIYNNSDHVVYADGLYIAEAYGANNANAQYAYQPNSGQYDWSKSYGMPANLNANVDYVYARTIIQLPGDGEQYPIQPGESIVVASTAVNHQSPYTGTDGVTISVQDPSLTVDLSKADFEAYYAPYIETGRPLASDVDNPTVPNVIVHRRSGNATDLIMDQTGRISWLIFNDEGMGAVSSWKGYDLPYTDGRERTDGTYIQIPVANIIDAVELQSSSTSTVYPKRLTAQQDAGWIAANGGARSSDAVIRKTKDVVNGRRVLMDTNNSTEDFLSIKANPRGFAD
ncbi:DUF4876 domain-containing protein [Sphingobacterium arenae]|uniref:DUF4876 domain-containing protein n=1 Tax=Sphingobacterium arenae TaxID=1280598 RepID=A0ABR7Y2U0_9SPHI|nr:DUF4876 domain-containing protein [Sphingobacterium arenae]MBD1425614.1 DUF4876 domain-containing protein [Sphingobacterium arenae]